MPSGSWRIATSVSQVDVRMPTASDTKLFTLHSCKFIPLQGARAGYQAGLRAALLLGVLLLPPTAAAERGISWLPGVN